MCAQLLCVANLLDHNAQTDIRDNDGKTATDLAFDRGNSDVVSYMDKEAMRSAVSPLLARIAKGLWSRALMIAAILQVR